MRGGDYTVARSRGRLLEYRAGYAFFPGPGISEPECWQHMQRGPIRATIEYGDSNQDAFWRFLRILHKHVEIAVFIEDSRIEQLILEFLARTMPACLHQVPIREIRLRVFVEILHVGMSRCAIEIEVVFLHILAVIS